MGQLDGIKVLDFTTLLPGPYATKLLADMGAEVTKIENPSKQRLEDIFPPHVNGKPLVYQILNKNKKIEKINLKEPKGLKKAKSLIIDADILVEQFRPETMERLGLDYETVKSINPDIIYCSISAFGQNSTKAGHDLNFIAKSGIASLLAPSPTPPALQLGDMVGGSLHAVIGILSALLQRERNGQGCHIDISMTHCLMPLALLKSAYPLAGLAVPKPRTGILDGGSIYDFYETKDGRYLSLASLEKKFFDMLLKGLKIEYSGDDYLFDKKLKERIKNAIREKPLQHWENVFEGLDACVEPVLTIDEVVKQNPDVFYDMDVKLPIRFID